MIPPDRPTNRRPLTRDDSLPPASDDASALPVLLLRMTQIEREQAEIWRVIRSVDAASKTGANELIAVRARLDTLSDEAGELRGVLGQLMAASSVQREAAETQNARLLAVEQSLAESAKTMATKHRQLITILTIVAAEAARYLLHR